MVGKMSQIQYKRIFKGYVRFEKRKAIYMRLGREAWREKRGGGGGGEKENKVIHIE